MAVACKSEVFPGGPGVEKMNRIGLAVVSENFSSEDNDKDSGVFAPCLIGFHEEIEEEGPVGRVATGVKKSPFLFVVSGGSPARGFEEGHEFALGKRFAAHSARGPAAEEERFNGIIRFAVGCGV